MRLPSRGRECLHAVALVVALLLTGCNEEKAQALLTAANSFKVEGNKAVAAYEELFTASLQQFEVDSQTEIARAKKALEDQFEKSGRQPIDMKTLLTLAGIAEGPGDRDVVEGEYAAARVLLDRFAGALAKLPDASYFVEDGTIGCTIEVAARLAKKFVDAGVRLKAAPVVMRGRRGQLTGMINRALRTADGEGLVVLVSQLKELERQGQELNDKAIRQSLVAAETGVAVVRAARRFQTLSVQDLLVIVGKTLEIVNESNAFNTVELGNRLTTLKTELEGDPYWKVVLAIDLNKKGSACAPAQAGG